MSRSVTLNRFHQLFSYFFLCYFISSEKQIAVGSIQISLQSPMHNKRIVYTSLKIVSSTVSQMCQKVLLLTESKPFQIKIYTTDQYTIKLQYLKVVTTDNQASRDVRQMSCVLTHAVILSDYQ